MTKKDDEDYEKSNKFWICDNGTSQEDMSMSCH